MKKLFNKTTLYISITSLFGVLVFVMAYLAMPKTTPVEAASASNWQAGNIIADGVFYDSNDMSTDQIQQFLDQKINSNGGCDIWGTRASEYGGGTRAQYGTAHGNPPPYICINLYYESPSSHANNLNGNLVPSGALSAAQIIKNAATTYSISVRALLVILEKESPGPLLDDTWPYASQYTNALGYGCPDNAPCDPQYAGLYNQITNAARQFQLYKNNPTAYRIQAQSSNQVLYNPTASCGSSSVFIGTQATAGLYSYTPYQPNQAALNNLYGTGDGCSAYGNRNFWRIFTDWFGSTQTNTSYSWSFIRSPSYINAQQTQQFTGSAINLQPGQTAYVTLSALNTGTQTWNKNVVHLGTAGPNDRNSSFKDSTWLSPSRIAMNQDSVAPGNSGTFTFNLTAPQTPGIYYEHFNLVADGATWMNDLGYGLGINVVKKQSISNDTNTSLSPNQSITGSGYMLSPDSQSVLRLQDGDLTLMSNFSLVWHTGTAGTTKGLFMQSDGNLVLYNTSNVATWSSGTSGNPGAYLALQTDGNLVIYSSTGTALWSTGTLSQPDHLSRVDYSLSNTNLYPGQSLLTPDGKYRMVLQKDGNLVVYSPTHPIWNSMTSGKPSAQLSMQPDGNLVIYDTSGNALWTSSTSGSGQSSLIMQPDGNLVIYRGDGTAAWSTGTSGIQ